MKRKDTILSITANISILAFNKENLKEELEAVALEIRTFGKGSFDFWQIEPVDVVIRTTALENTKIVRFIFKSNIYSFQYENQILVNLALNLQKIFNLKNKFMDIANQCYILETYNSRLDK